ncbi:MAG: ATP-dependent Clp protease ATP-binding subunit [Anaerolineae bacterium]|nr:MAG: ATP-dependent Clp protease ATP-binding subunit [Anaerolineae bacterium]
MGTLNPDLPSKELHQALNEAAALMGQTKQRAMMPEHLLLAFIQAPGSAAYRLLAHFAEKRGFEIDELKRRTEAQVRSRIGRDADFHYLSASSQPIPLSHEMLVVLDEGRAIAQATDEVWIGTDHALAAMSQAGVSTAGLLQRLGITPKAMTDLLADRALGRRTTRDWVEAARRGEMAPVNYRESLLRDLINLLSLSGDRHVVLVGPTGAGRRSLVYSLAQLVAEGKGPASIKSVVEIAEAALVDNADGAARAGLRQAKGGVLFVPNIGRFFGGRLYSEFPKAATQLQKAFFEDDPIIVGTATEAEYNDRLAANPAVTENSHQLRVPPADVAETTAVLGTLKPHLEQEYGLTIANDALEKAASLAGRYLSATALPGAAVQLVHRACALVRMSTQTQLPFAPEARPDAQLDAEDVTVAASAMTGIPVTKLGADERARYARMVEHIHQRIIGQEEAVLAVSRAVKTARVGLKDPKRPIGSFLFLGPTGVGKTELAKALADFLFGNEEAMVVLDMSEYQQEDSLNRLIGAPPGYVGFEGGGQLTDRVIESPYTVVLFDEVEKAHSRVLDVLLQMMEEGRLTDGKGRTASFSETVIILTSNLGSAYLGDPSMGEEAKELALAEVKRHFRPEFLNRLDDIIVFHRLTDDQLWLILGLMLKKEFTLAAGRGLNLKVTDAARTWLLAQTEHPEWGARPLRRIIQRHIREPLADYLLAHDPPPGTTVRVDGEQDGLTFETA